MAPLSRNASGRTLGRSPPNPDPDPEGTQENLSGGIRMAKTKTTIYWIATLFVAFIMTISGVLALTHSPDMMKALAHLGSPPYFSNLLGVSKLAGVCVLLLPGIARLKEWPYAGFGITILSASYSHLLSADA